MCDHLSIIILIGLEINLLFWSGLRRVSDRSDYTPACRQAGIPLPAAERNGVRGGSVDCNGI
jgi:hypothetical protein